jgi:hypothetical protein
MQNNGFILPIPYLTWQPRIPFFFRVLSLIDLVVDVVDVSLINQSINHFFTLNCVSDVGSGIHMCVLCHWLSIGEN